jgi:hypothetical protein
VTGRDVDDPLAALTDADRSWLDRMGDVLPPGWVVRGSSRWVLFSPDLDLMEWSVR